MLLEQPTILGKLEQVGHLPLLTLTHTAQKEADYVLTPLSEPMAPYRQSRVTSQSPSMDSIATVDLANQAPVKSQSYHSNLGGYSRADTGSPFEDGEKRLSYAPPVSHPSQQRYLPVQPR